MVTKEKTQIQKNPNYFRGKSGKSKKVSPFSRLELSEWNFMFHLRISRTLYQFQLLPTQQPSWCPIG